MLSVRLGREVNFDVTRIFPLACGTEEMSTVKVQDGELTDDHLTDEMKSIEVSHTLTPQLSALSSRDFTWQAPGYVGLRFCRGEVNGS